MSNVEAITLQARSARYCGPERDFWVTLRRPLERLANGMWRADYTGGTVETFDAEPETRQLLACAFCGQAGATDVYREEMFPDAPCCADEPACYARMVA